MAVVSVRTRVLLIAALAALGYAATRVWAQGQPASDAASLATVATELHQIRLAIEESTKAQTQIQATAAYLSVQKDHMVQLASRVDPLRKDLDAVSEQIRTLTAEVSDDERALSTGTLPSDDQRAVQQQLQSSRQQLVSLRAKEQQLRAREAELQQMIQAEDARWNDLVSRMEQAIRR